MTIDREDLLNSIIESLDRIHHISLDDIPNIDLYMDQVTTFMESRLRSTTRNPVGDKILTKTMINNYAKNNLLPPPLKKKYSKEHILVLIFIYYLKNILTINDIQTLLEPLTSKYFTASDGLTLEEIYQTVFQLEQQQVIWLEKDVLRKFEKAKQTFTEEEDEEKEFLQTFSFIAMLALDVYVKKQMIERMIDELNEKKPAHATKKK